ncbi:MAG: hypothetical protein SGJ18_00100 [Pseudomonadota bacterium]|nr:hypothetical protein [Pseudomonadota bacterium]
MEFAVLIGMGGLLKNYSLILIRLFVFSIMALSLACSSDYKGMASKDQDNFENIPVIPYIPDLAFSVITTTPDRRMNLTPVLGSPPDQHQGAGKALVKLKNNTTQVTSGTLSLEKASESLILTVMEICPSDALKNCTGINGLSFSLELVPGQEYYFTIHLQASGTIGFAPVANAIKLTFQGTGDDASISLTSTTPVVNEN